MPLVPLWVGGGELGLFGFLPNETKGLIFSIFSFGLKVVVYEVLVGVCVLAIPISFVSGKTINGLLVVLVGVSRSPTGWKSWPNSGKSGRVNAETSQEGKRKLKLLLPRPGGFVNWGTGFLLGAGGLGCFPVGVGGLTFVFVSFGFLCLGPCFPPVFRISSCSASVPVSTWLLKKGGTTT